MRETHRLVRAHLLFQGILGSCFVMPVLAAAQSQVAVAGGLALLALALASIYAGATLPRLAVRAPHQIFIISTLSGGALAFMLGQSALGNGLGLAAIPALALNLVAIAYVNANAAVIAPDWKPMWALVSAPAITPRDVAFLERATLVGGGAHLRLVPDDLPGRREPALGDATPSYRPGGKAFHLAPSPRTSADASVTDTTL